MAMPGNQRGAAVPTKIWIPAKESRLMHNTRIFFLKKQQDHKQTTSPPYFIEIKTHTKGSL